MRVLPNVAYRVIGRLAVSRVSRALHPVLYRWTGGRGIVGRFLGARMVLLTTTGRRSGKTRTATVFAVPFDDGWVVVPSAGGTGRIAWWYWNLLAEPKAMIEDHGRRIPVVARVTDGAERDRLFQLATEAYPGMRSYQAVTREQIPVVVLERSNRPAP